MRIPQTILMTTALFMLAACGRDPGTETDKVTDQMNENREEVADSDGAKEWMNERQEARKELADLREKLEDRLTREEKRLADGIKDTEKRAECAAHITELKYNIARIDRSLVTVDGSTSSDWQRVKAETRNVADSTGNWFDRQAEKIDHGTDMDSDHDGH